MTSADSPLVPDALSWLRGSWRIERRLTDHLSGSAGWFRGTALFEPPGPAGPASDNSKRPAADPGVTELIYDENGELALGEHRGPASRRLVYRGRADGTADVFFADGREFYWLDPRPGRWQARHQCGRDEYLVHGTVLGTEIYTERWLVTGPAKDYEIMTTLTRVNSE